jgi:hypothetical protein
LIFREGLEGVVVDERDLTSDNPHLVIFVMEKDRLGLGVLIVSSALGSVFLHVGWIESLRLVID